MFITVILPFLCLVFVNADDVVVHPYTQVAYTTTGQPCIGGCSPETHECVASWPPKNEPCVIHDVPARKFYTTQRTKYKFCLSNCGRYSWKSSWCYVTSNGEWDHCIPQQEQHIHISANSVVLPYTKVAFTTSGAPCIGGCSPDTHKCIASWPPKNEPCTLQDIEAPKYLTTQDHSKAKYCLSNCGRYAWDTPWCFVSSDGQWDNCIKHDEPPVLPYTTVAYTTSGIACLGGCSPDTKECVASWPPKNEPCVSHDTPAPKFYTTQERSKHSVCLSNCEKYDSGRFWCYVTSDAQWDYCTTQQQVKPCEPVPSSSSSSSPLSTPKFNSNTELVIPMLPLNFDNILGSRKSNCNSFFKRMLGGSTDWNRPIPAYDGFLEEQAKAFEDVSHSNIRVEKIETADIALKSYIMGSIKGNISVPAVLRARVNNSTIHQNSKMDERFGEASDNEGKQFRNSSFVYRRLLGVDVGGPNANFNSVPLSDEVINTLTNLEEVMKAWCCDGEESVDVLMVAFYLVTSSGVPHAVGIDLTFRNEDDSVFLHCKDSVYLNIVY